MKLHNATVLIAGASRGLPAEPGTYLRGLEE